MKATSPLVKTIPLKMVGGNNYGRYPIISTEQTFNMLVSDDWLAPLAGYKKVLEISDNGQGRGISSSAIFKKMVVVIDNIVYLVSDNLAYLAIGSIDTFDGDVFIAENNAGQIAICDKKDIWIYDPNATPKFQKAVINFVPGYIAFQNTYFISVDLTRAEWRLSNNNNGLIWDNDATSVGDFQTKPNIPLAAIPMPGRGNSLMIIGEMVGEFWFNTGQQLFPYQKNTYQNSDYGTPNAATIAASDQFVVWLGINEKSGPVIMLTEGGTPQAISDEGLNFKLAQLSNPKNSYGFLFKQDGHLLYFLTFPSDNFSLLFDFETKTFFTPTDTLQGYHIAKRVISFNNTYYFVSFRDGNLYEMNSKYMTYDGEEIPRMRVLPPFSLPNRTRFITQNISFNIEQGEYGSLQAVDYSFSKDNGNSYSNIERIELSTTGKRERRINFWNKGIALSFVSQFRFWGQGRFLVSNGTMSYYQ